MATWKILTGTAIEVEQGMNAFSKHNHVQFFGISTTNDQTTVIIRIEEYLTREIPKVPRNERLNK